ncbi:MAG: hypothetical protein Q8807_03550 ['Waltheria sp.' little leaf phytoplasma]|nr:hypothetical protein ['Waltheria sp.' little leaf phytoplasma]
MELCLTQMRLNCFLFFEKLHLIYCFYFFAVVTIIFYRKSSLKLHLINNF